MGCVDFCDADAYCKWAGKRLCGRIGGGTLTVDESIEPKASEWVNACTQGGKTKLPYGDAFEFGQCLDRTLVPDGVVNKETAQAALADPTKIAPDCHGTEPPFDKICSMSVGLQEWDATIVGDAVSGFRSGIRGGGLAQVRTPTYPYVPYCADRLPTAYIMGLGTDVGFRCCGVTAA